jgi:hypothetical protein
MERKISVGVDVPWSDDLAPALDRAVGVGFDFIATPLFTPDPARVVVPDDAAPLAREAAGWHGGGRGGGRGVQGRMLHRVPLLRAPPQALTCC